jgi:Uma2 family endonuclease
MANAPVQRMTAAEYLAWEREQPERHGYLDGEVFCMSGGTARHAALQSAATIELGIAHREAPCRVLGTDMRIVAEDGIHYVYADATVVCGRMQFAPDTKDTLANPSVVVEVLSKSTEAYDRGRKGEGYRKIPSLTDYVLVSQSRPHVEHYQRLDGGEWHFREAGPGGRVRLATGGVLEVDALYRGAFEIDGE